MRQGLLSQRFSQGNSQAVRHRLSALQGQMVEAFRQRLETGEYRLATEHCPCGADDDTLIAEIDRYGLPLASVLCARCGAVRTNPYLDDASLDDFYRQMYQVMYARAPQVEAYFANQATYGSRIAALYERELRPTANVLEVGCGAGGGLAVFQNLGHRVAGCDLSRELVAFGVQQGLNRLWHGTTDEMPCELESERWDLIILHHVFEHVQSPAHILNLLSGLLAPQGRILIIVPNILQIDRFPNPAGNALKFLHVAHKFNYTPECLEVVAAKAGLAAATRVPPAHLRTAWSEMPELWMEFKSGGVDTPPLPPRAACGERVLAYLRDTERRFLAGDFEALDEIRSNRNSPPQAKPRRHLRKIWDWVAGRRSPQAA